MGRIALLPIIPLMIMLSACQTPAATPTALPPVDTPIPTPTPLPPMDTLIPTHTPSTPTISPTPSIPLTPTAFAPFDAVITVANVNLRAGPGYLFPVLRVLQEGGTVSVRGKAPGGQWFRVRTPEMTDGWVYVWLLRANVDLQQAPIIDPPNVQWIKGRVRDTNGTPILGIGFSVSQRVGTITQTDTVLTDINGEFFSFLPLSASGTWAVLQNAISCNSNAYADASCTNYKNGYKGIVEPPSVDVTLPYTDVLEFTWK